MNRVIPLADIPRVLYTYEADDGTRVSLVVKDDLHVVPNHGALKPAMLNPRTPTLVMTMLYNELANKVRTSRDRLTVAKSVALRTTPEGLTFYEVDLTKEGFEYIKSQNVRGGYYYYHPEYVVFDPKTRGARRMFNAFPKRLKDALRFCGLSV